MISRVRVEGYGQDAGEVSDHLEVAAAQMWSALIAEGLTFRGMEIMEEPISRVRPGDDDFEQKFGTAVFGFTWRGRRVFRFQPSSDMEQFEGWEPRQDIYGRLFPDGAISARYGDPLPPVFPAYRVVLKTLGSPEHPDGEEIDVTDAVIVTPRMRKPDLHLDEGTRRREQLERAWAQLHPQPCLVPLGETATLDTRERTQ